MNEKLISLLLDGSRNLNHTDLKIMREIESYFDFEDLNNEQIAEIGNCILGESLENKNNMYLEITNIEGDIIYSYIGINTNFNNKTNVNLKRNTVKQTKHNSFYPVIMYAIGFEDINFFDDNKLSFVSGGFPLKVKGKIKYIVAIDGLKDDQNFNAVTKGLEKFLNQKIPAYSGWMI